MYGQLVRVDRAFKVPPRAGASSSLGYVARRRGRSRYPLTSFRGQSISNLVGGRYGEAIKAAVVTGITQAFRPAMTRAIRAELKKQGLARG